MHMVSERQHDAQWADLCRIAQKKAAPQRRPAAGSGKPSLTRGLTSDEPARHNAPERES